MAMRALAGNIILFYMHFSYNVANPIIYAFFNQNFRKEMKDVLGCR
jgi:cholecystokinin A receptor/hypocretin (orexin) receptor 2